ncbi:MAG: hypothetical protein AAGI25_16895 [Bacteroidota bacterium]
MLLHTGDKWEHKINGEKVWAYNYDIHTGAIGGLVGKIMAFFQPAFRSQVLLTGVAETRRKGSSRRRINQAY